MGKKQTATGKQLARRGGKAVAATKVPRKLLADLRKLIDESRQSVAQTTDRRESETDSPT